MSRPVQRLSRELLFSNEWKADALAKSWRILHMIANEISLFDGGSIVPNFALSGWEFSL